MSLIDSLSFLHADPTRSALQVFLRQSGTTVSDLDGLPAEHGTEEGIWINADPVPNCVVCNIGESMFLSFRAYSLANVNHSVWEIWTNGLYKSTLHRVVHRGSSYR
jgi:isopenicillin N synthase-like dioxygenase